MNNYKTLNNYFDHIFIISACKSFKRRENMDIQMKLINCDKYSYWYGPAYDFSNSKIFKENTNVTKLSYLRCSFAHYSLWKTCYELEYDNVLILEDDTMFLKNIDKCYKILDKFYNKKNNSDIYLFDYVFNNLSLNSITFEDINIRIDKYLLGDNYYVNKKGLEYLIKMHEKMNYVCDMYFDKIIDLDTGQSININNRFLYLKYSYFDGCTNAIFEYDTNNNIPFIKLNVSDERLSIQQDKEYDDNLDKNLYNNFDI